MSVCLECDNILERCCAYVTNWGVIPSETFGKTPNNEKDWFNDNECNMRVGGQALTNCPYTCGNFF